MNKARDYINEIVKKGVAPTLKSNGFRKQGLHFARRNGSVSHYLNIQLSSWNCGSDGGFYINAGVAFDDLYSHFGELPPKFPKYENCQFLVRMEQLNPQLPQQFRVDDSTDLDALASTVAKEILDTFVKPLERVNSLQSFAKTGWVNTVPWGFPALFHFVTGNKSEARRLVQLEADSFADRGLTFESVAKGLNLSFE